MSAGGSAVSILYPYRYTFGTHIDVIHISIYIGTIYQYVSAHTSIAYMIICMKIRVCVFDPI
jgi:hypothetical protein